MPNAPQSAFTTLLCSAGLLTALQHPVQAGSDPAPADKAESAKSKREDTSVKSDPNAKANKTATTTDTPKTTGKRLEDDPYALEKLRKILEGGIPELMTVKVKVPASVGDDGATAGSVNRKVRKQAGVHSANAPSDSGAPGQLGLVPSPPAGSGGKNTGSAHGNPTGHGQPAKNGHDAHWDYVGDYGPESWGKMRPEFATCATGKTQSPVHIQPGDALPADLEPISFEYGPLVGRIHHNGHTVQVDVQGTNMLVVRGKVYRLVQFHFHHPAEEMINYRGFPMVAHLVHKDSEGRLAVVALLMELGAENPVLAQAWARMPLKAGEQYLLDAGRLSVADTLPKERGYYTFTGSLTTPPCSEGVTWVVMKQPVTISQTQLETFRRLFPLNARPVQPLNARLVQESR